MKRIFELAGLLCGLAALPLQAQLAVPPPSPDYQPLSGEQLDQLLGPIALYPDPLVAQILPAATVPTQIVLADRFLNEGGDPNQIDQQPWDPSVQAVAHYPEVLKWMDDNLDWTMQLGQAFLNQQQDVMDSIQRLRQSAQNLGNLQSTPQQQVIEDEGSIEILPANPQVIYVPVYQPEVVFYQRGAGRPFINFGIGFQIGGWLNFDFDWHHHDVIVWNRDHPRPADWWHERPSQRTAVIASHSSVWRPVNRPGFVAARRDDRGWNNPVAHSAPPTANRFEKRPPETHNAAPINTRRLAPAPPASRPPPAPVQHYAVPGRSASTGALIGIQSSRDARTFSNRGAQSMRTVTPSAPASHPAPARPAPAAPARGGGGNHDSGAKPRH
jgi:Protein of unknown function (DUF3300)